MENFEEVFEDLFSTMQFLDGIKIPESVIANRKTLGFYFDTCSGAIVWGKENEIEYAYLLTYHRFTGHWFYRLNEKGAVWENEFPDDDEIEKQPKRQRELFPYFFRCNEIIENIVQPKIKKMINGELDLDLSTEYLEWWDIIED
jgi:hypothetical protein